MKKKIKMTLAALSIGTIILLTGCQGATKSFGGSMTLELPANQKLEEITFQVGSE